MIAIISNRSRPDYGKVIVPLPIPDEQYDQVIEKLESFKIGDFRACDCHVNELTECPPVLKCLESEQVNIDELDYLIKRLDSFVPSELASFSALTVKYNLTEMTDLINLSYCCQNALAVTDFSDMSNIGRGYALAQNGGCMATDELNSINLVVLAQKLLSGKSGTVTPYGVLYDEGFSLESIYDGTMLPPYYYKPGLVNVQVITEKDPDNCPEFTLPVPEKQMIRTLKRVGYQEGDSHMIVKLDSELPAEIAEGLCTRAEDVFSLNRAVAAIARLDQSQYEKFAAAVDYAHPQTPEQYQKLAESLDMFDFIPGAQDADDVGRHMILESGHFEVDPNLEDYIDFEAYGRDHMRGGEGKFGEYGFIAYTGDERLDFGTENKQTIGQRMGGMT